MIGDLEGDDDRSSALAWLESASRDRDDERAAAGYLAAAAVLSTFRIDDLRPVPGDADACDAEDAPDPRDTLRRLSREVGPEGDVRQLDDAPRRAALRRLGSRPAMWSARRLNAGPTDSPIQQSLDLLIASAELPSLDGLSLDMLLGVERATQWLDGIVEPLPDRSGLAARIARERLMLPMRRLAGANFIGRDLELARLADHVGVRTARSGGVSRVSDGRSAPTRSPRVPLHLHGPGGIGKSALLARFILDHADLACASPMPFVYLDFDRAALDPRDPVTLLDSAIRQLRTQFPRVDDDDHALNTLPSQLRERLVSFDTVEVSKSVQLDSQRSLINRLCALLERIAMDNGMPVLWVLDTLEEAEYQGHSALLVTWSLLTDLSARVDRLRIVTAGRSALPPDLPRESVELRDLPLDAAQRLIVERTARLPGGPISAADAAEIVERVGTVPLSLALASRVVLNEGIAGLRDAVSRRRLFARIQSERQQGMLFQRILAHVQIHDPELVKVANPGLVLRRITPELIERVLAEPCGLVLTPMRTARDLFDDLGREVGLVDPHREPGALWHLPAVRRVMLPDLLGTLGDLPRRIHVAAAEHYRGRTSEVERAEEIYHRLWLGESADTLDPLWAPHLQRHLRGAVDELEPQARIWLGDKLGIELAPELRARADDAVWERQAEQRARTLLNRGLVEEALAALDERVPSGLPSPLYALRADALKLLGRYADAHAAIDAGLAAAELAGDQGLQSTLWLRRTFLLEATDELARAFDAAFTAASLAGPLRDPLELLSASAAILRIAGKLAARRAADVADRVGGAGGAGSANGPPDAHALNVPGLDAAEDPRVAATRARAKSLVATQTVRSQLPSRPALLREIAAVLGADDVPLLTDAVRALGVTADDLVLLVKYARASGASLPTAAVGALAKARAAMTSRGVGEWISTLVPVFPAFFAERLAQAVEDTLHQVVAVARNVARPTLDSVAPWQRDQLSKLIAGAFSEQEIALIARDTLEAVPADLAPPNASPSDRVAALLRLADERGELGVLAMRMVRALPDSSVLRPLLQGLGKTL